MILANCVIQISKDEQTYIIEFRRLSKSDSFADATLDAIRYISETYADAMIRIYQINLKAWEALDATERTMYARGMVEEASRISETQVLPAVPPNTLTPRELEVCYHYVICWLPAKRVAEIVELELGTLNNYIASSFKKMGVNSKLGLLKTLLEKQIFAITDIPNKPEEAHERRKTGRT